MSAIVHDPRAARPAPPMPTPPAPAIATRFEDVLAAIAGDQTLGFSATGPAGLSHSVKMETTHGRAQRFDRDVASSIEFSSDACATRDNDAAISPRNPEALADATDNLAGVQRPDSNSPRATQAGLTPIEPLPQARANTVAAPKSSVASPAPITRRGAGAASPFSVHMSTGADGVHVHVAAPVDPNEVQTMRRQIESFFAERGLRVHLHINGARVDGLEERHG
ncbi:hypothetical protein [Vitreimonas flagellata]|uniref:hypothetical protein n=1 Tax=Vitreimonas flagellata TaxID=2560861 RepID=UPI0010753B1F|nr:hypothetical protein [Vitreimonas flagellata]